MTAGAHPRLCPTPGRGRAEQALASEDTSPLAQCPVTPIPARSRAQGPIAPPPRPHPHRQCPRVRSARQLQIARGAVPGARWELLFSSPARRYADAQLEKERTTTPSVPPAKRRASPAGNRDTGGGETPSPAVVSVAAAAPEPPPPPPPRWAVFRFLFFGIVGRPVPRRLGAQRGSADGAALFTRASVRRAAERRGFG